MNGEYHFVGMLRSLKKLRVKMYYTLIDFCKKKGLVSKGDENAGIHGNFVTPIN